MKKIEKKRRQALIFQILRTKTQESALSAPKIHEQLKATGLKVNLRTIRRDLTDLSGTHGLTSIGEHPEKFYPTKDFEIKTSLGSCGIRKFTRIKYFFNIS